MILGCIPYWLSRDPIEEDGGLNLYGFNYNNAINNIDSDGRAVVSTEGGFSASSSIPSVGIGDRAGALQSRINALAKDDLKKIFLQTQQSILEKLADNRCCCTPETAKWLDDVIRDFMDPLFDALEGRGNMRWKDTFDEVDQRSAMAGATDGRLVGVGPGSTGGSSVVGDALGDWTHRMLAAREMALTHIDQDLRQSLVKNGAGNDAVWECVGRAVSESEKVYFNGVERMLSRVGGIVSPTFNVGVFRDTMRDDVKGPQGAPSPSTGRFRSTHPDLPNSGGAGNLYDTKLPAWCPANSP